MFNTTKKIWRISNLQTFGRIEIFRKYRFDLAELPKGEFYQYSEEIYDFMETMQPGWSLWERDFKALTEFLFADMLEAKLISLGYIKAIETNEVGITKKKEKKKVKKNDMAATVTRKSEKNTGNAGRNTPKPIDGKCSECNKSFHVYEMFNKNGAYYCSSCSNNKVMFESITTSSPNIEGSHAIHSENVERKLINKVVDQKVNNISKRKRSTRPDKNTSSKVRTAPKIIDKENKSQPRLKSIGTSGSQKTHFEEKIREIDSVPEPLKSTVLPNHLQEDSSSKEKEAEELKGGTGYYLLFIFFLSIIIFSISSSKDTSTFNETEDSINFVSQTNVKEKAQQSDISTLNSLVSSKIEVLPIRPLFAPTSYEEIDYQNQAIYLNESFVWEYRSGVFYFLISNTTRSDISIIDFTHFSGLCEEMKSVERVFRLSLPQPLPANSIKAYKAELPIFSLIANGDNCLNLVAAYHRRD